VAKGGEFIRHVAVNDGPECGGNLSPERPGVERGELSLHGHADITLRGVPHGVKRLDLEFTFTVRGRNIESEFPSKPLGTGNLADTAMLITLTTDFHLATLPGVEDVAILSSMVLCGVYNSSSISEIIDCK
jgi:hypothetical protein